jgi:hypothetical protein
MDCIVYLRDGVVYIPTQARLDAGGHMGSEPVEVVPVSDSSQLREAFGRCFARGNPMRAMPKTRADWPPSPTLKAARLKSWSTFEKGLSTWSIVEANGAWQICGHRKLQGRGTVEDATQKTEFPPGSTAEDVISRMIAILQEKAGLPRQ